MEGIAPSGSGRRSFAEPDERVVVAEGLVTIESVAVGGVAARRVVHAPGWRWSRHTAPEAGTPRCPRTHVGVLTSGRLHVEPPDGEPFEAAAGDLVVILPGHDAWTVGEEPAVLVELGG